MVQNTHKDIVQQTAVVILAAGKGTRMGRADCAKVCFEIDNVPAINRTVRTFKKLRFSKFVIVVGSLAEQVMETVTKEEPQAIYVHQSPQLGTGDAARKAAAALEQIGHTGPVLVTLGDKFIEAAAVETLVDGFIRHQADFALVTIPKTKATEASGGRVFLDATSQVLGIIETPDLARQAVVDELKKLLAKKTAISSATIQKIAKKYFANPKKLAVALPELLALAAKDGNVNSSQLETLLNSPKYNLTIDGQTYTAQRIESHCRGVNPSLYLFTAAAFYQGVGMIDNNNAQHEYYLTDAVKHLGNVFDSHGEHRFRVRAISVENPDLIQGFNSPNELLAIQDYVRRKEAAQTMPVISAKPHLNRHQYCTVREWIAKIETKSPSFTRWLKIIYGGHPGLHEEKRRSLIKVLRCYGKRFGFDEKVVIVRAPGRLNLMGRHVDHRGGFTNFLAIDRETICVAGLRDDDNVVAVNTEPTKFKSQQFNISELIGRFAWSDWVNFVNSDWVRNLLYSTAGDWVNYIKAAMLRLQHQYQDVKIRGVNIALSGNVPMAAGLSSSSTIVVATLQAAIALNNLELTSQQFIDLCGEGEWFVGSRGGAGDHAAIYLGQRGKIAHVGYLPFRVDKIIDAPADYQVVIANSHIKAAKSSAAKHMFNSRIAAYNLGLALFKQRCPEVAQMVEYVRDIDPARLGCLTSQVYRLLMKVPRTMARKDLEAILSSEHAQLLKTNFASHNEPPHYDIRGVLLFGAAEIMRSKICIDYLERGEVDKFGMLMKISHEGDRVAKLGEDSQYHPFEAQSSDQYLNNLITDLASEDPMRVLNAQLYMQPGSYACSTKEIDSMVDIACSVPGVAGAQIAGAGLGGCIMILAQKESIDPLHKALVGQYYRPNNLAPAIMNCITVEGAGLAEF
jgi:N-acetylgalactosamine kinase